MTSRPWIAALALAGGAALLVATPAAADRLITMKSHTDAMEMMGQKTPAQDENYLYWFGGDAIPWCWNPISAGRLASRSTGE